MGAGSLLVRTRITICFQWVVGRGAESILVLESLYASVACGKGLTTYLFRIGPLSASIRRWAGGGG